MVTVIMIQYHLRLYSEQDRSVHACSGDYHILQINNCGYYKFQEEKIGDVSTYHHHITPPVQ